MNLEETITTIVTAAVASVIGSKVKKKVSLVKISKAIEARLDVLEKIGEVGIYICDADGKCIYTNNYLAEIFDCDKIEMLNFGWTKKILNQKVAFDKWAYAVEHKISYNDEYQIKLKGELVTIETTADPVFTEKGEVEYYIGKLNIKK